MKRKTKKNKMWGGRFKSDQDKLMQNINSSISFDSRLYDEDIKASIAHARMLAKKNIITTKDSQKIISGLKCNFFEFSGLFQCFSFEIGFFSCLNFKPEMLKPFKGEGRRVKIIIKK